MSVFARAGTLHDMAYTGPMLSGLSLDTHTLIRAGYAACQLEIAKRLQDAKSGKWKTPETPARANKMLLDIDTKRGGAVIPPYLVGRTLEGEELDAALQALHLESGIRPERDARHLKDTGIFHVQSVEIRVHEFGYASAAFHGVIEALRDLSLQEFKETAERIGSELNRFGPLFLATFDAVREKTADFSIPAKQGDETSAGLSPATTPGALFWVHRIFSVACLSADDFEFKKEQSRNLLYSDTPGALPDISIRPDMAIFAGNGNSAIVYEAPHVPFHETQIYLEAVRTQNVLYAAAEDIARALFQISNDLSAAVAEESAKTSAAHARMNCAHEIRAALLQGIYENMDNRLDPQSNKIWHALESAWQTREIFSEISTQLAVIEKFRFKVREYAADARDRALVRAVWLIAGASCLLAALEILPLMRAALQSHSLLP